MFIIITTINFIFFIIFINTTTIVMINIRVTEFSKDLVEFDGVSVESDEILSAQHKHSFTGANKAQIHMHTRTFPPVPKYKHVYTHTSTTDTCTQPYTHKNKLISHTA